MKAVFADTFFYLGLLNERDKHHRVALATASQTMVPIVTTTWVLVEVANALAGSHTRKRVRAFVQRLKADPRVRVTSATQELFDRGLAFYDTRPDKEWSLTDCISFVVMRDQNITDALTGDHHFKQAGFTALLA